MKKPEIKSEKIKNVAGKSKGFISEFKEFVLKGNVMDMAIGVIIGTAFGAIVTSLTTNFINPLINSIGGVEVGGSIRLPWVDYTGLDSAAVKALSINYGDFITKIKSIVNFSRFIPTSNRTNCISMIEAFSYLLCKYARLCFHIFNKTYLPVKPHSYLQNIN